MANLSQIDKSVVENPDFSNPTEDITININIGNGESVSFVAQKEFFTPRRIATNRGDVALMENVVDMTVTNVPIIKMSGINKDITKPQYYLNSIVSDQYQDLPIDKYFLELDNELAVPDYIGSYQEQRELALRTLLNLEEQTAAAIAGDPIAYTEAAAQVDDNYADLAGLQDNQPLLPEEVLSPEEADQLAALDFVGLSEDEFSSAAADIIEPLPEINDSDLIRFGNKLPLLKGKTAGTETINAGIKLLNSGVQKVEDSQQTGTDADGKCKYITVAKGKKGILGTKIGKKKERKVSREKTEKQLALVKEDIAAQEASPTTIINTKSGLATTVKIAKSSVFAKAIRGISKAGILGVVAGMVFPPLAIAATIGAGAVAYAGAAGAVAMATTGGKAFYVPKGCRLMKKDEVLKLLNKTKTELEGILDKDCE